jgi:sterol desaturase/sphingolipid hydroxylase (fatty acid hydroxylase superfamily)
MSDPFTFLSSAIGDLAQDIPPLAILIEQGPMIFAFDFGRYVIAATLMSVTVWIMLRTRLAARRLQPRDASFADRRREFFLSMQSAGVYLVGACFLIWGMQHGIFHPYVETYGLAADLGLLALLLVLHDAYFYWAHRMMHHPRMFKLFHRAHHRSTTPTPWAAYSFAIPEAAVMFLFVLLWAFFIAAPGWVWFTWLNIQILRNVMGHAGVEVHPRWWLSSPLTRWICTTTHHDLHHSGGFKYNYGFYFTWWDKWMGTEHPGYAARFAEVTGSGPVPIAAPSGPAIQTA